MRRWVRVALCVESYVVAMFTYLVTQEIYIPKEWGAGVRNGTMWGSWEFEEVSKSCFTCGVLCCCYIHLPGNLRYLYTSIMWAFLVESTEILVWSYEPQHDSSLYEHDQNTEWSLLHALKISLNFVWRPQRPQNIFFSLI